MNKTKQASGSVAMILVLALVGGCATAGYQKAERGAVSMNNTKAEVQEAFGQVTVAVTSLDTIMNAKVGDLRPLFKDFVSQSKTLESAAASAKGRAISMQTKNQEYFTAWAQEIELIQDPAIKSQSLTRYRQTLASYQDVEKMLVKTRDAYVPLISSFNDLQIALKQDLTPSGLSAVRPSYEKARQQAINLQSIMKSTGAAIDEAAKQLTPQASGTR